MDDDGSAETIEGEALGARVALAVEQADDRAQQAARALARRRLDAALLDHDAGRVELGRYVLLQRIGRGGMGVVHAAYDPELDRRIALKIVAIDDAQGSQGRARLLREAQALARLNHPNVVTVHDVGVVEDAVWIAMELVEGKTLSAWIAAQSPTTSAIVDVLLLAGAGIAAAHHVGLVHRDIKPDNVMIASGGGATSTRRVVVMDFGLARIAADTNREASAATEPVSDSLTRSGTIAGTPAYMAPEQHVGLRADPRTDQFGFCVMAWEALYGERPFAGASLAELVLAVCEGRRRPAPRRDVPDAIRVALERGLAVEPGLRFSDMDALLAAITRGRQRRRRMMIGAGLVGLVGAVAAVPIIDAQRHRLAIARCGDQADAIRELWPGTDAPQRIAVALAAGGNALAEESTARISAGLDTWTASWRSAVDEACQARVDGHIAPDEHARIDTCFAERQQAVATLISSLQEWGSTEALDIHRAVSLVAQLEPPRTCIEVARTSAVLVPPPQLDTQEIAAVRAGFGRVRILGALGQRPSARAEAEALLARAQATGWTPLVLEAQIEAGDALEQAGDPAAAEPLLVEAYLGALASGRDTIAIAAAQHLTFTIGYQLARPQEGLLWGRHGEGLVARGTAEPLRRARLSSSIATVLASRGQHAEALARYADALEVLRGALGEQHPQVADMLANVAMVEGMMGDHAASSSHYHEALTIAEATLGPNHPDVATLLNDIAILQATHGDMRGARGLFERVLAIHERALGPEHPQVAHALNNLAGTLHVLGEPDAAEPLLRRAIAVHERALGPDHPQLGAPLYVLGGLLHARGDLDGAEGLFRRALDLRTRGYGEDDATVAEPLTGLAAIALARGRPTEAIGLAERAVQLRRDAAPLEIAESRFVLAQALDAVDRKRALELARLALADLAAEDPPNQRLDVEAWLRAREADE